MIASGYRKLITQLAARTEQGDVNWKRTPSEGEFVIYVKDFGLSLRYGQDEEYEPSYVVVVLRDMAGGEVDRFAIFATEPEWDMISALYQSARRKALRIDEAVCALADELEKPVVGQDRPGKP